jgi:1-deoxy-D-xylulose-5-phosphate reductoisomerase
MKRYPMLNLARQAAQSGGTFPAIFNAANEVAVTAFLARRLRFTDISRIVEEVLSASPSATESLDSVLAADAEARRMAELKVI